MIEDGISGAGASLSGGWSTRLLSGCIRKRRGRVSPSWTDGVRSELFSTTTRATLHPALHPALRRFAPTTIDRCGQEQACNLEDSYLSR